MDLRLMKAVFPILDHIWNSVGTEDGKTYTLSLQACRVHDEIDVSRLELVEVVPHQDGPFPADPQPVAGGPTHAELMHLWHAVVEFRDRHQISHDEKIFDTDKIAEEATTFIADCIAITGYGEHDDSDEYVGGIATRSQG